MKKTLIALFLSAALFACKDQKIEKIIHPRDLKPNESFNEFPKVKGDAFAFVKVDSGKKLGDVYAIKFKDTVISVQNDPKPLADKFFVSRFLNTQKTALLAQVADSSDLVSPFYIISLKNGQIDAIKLERASIGKDDKKVTAGLQEISLSIVLVNNDFVVTLINGNVYPLKRQNDSERIQGRFLLNSADKNTLIFATANSLYQVNYKTGETYDLIVAPGKLNAATFTKDIMQNYRWEKTPKGTSFLKEYDSNKILELSDFK
ncbi:hypothetical protein [Pedobacter jamesrossensis]|uniref:Uncharacterized protein n=1 Tax=Pedobacter jamesrossensis TaxID=1908238 RepID=A0ABV8NH13_9SPHI